MTISMGEKIKKLRKEMNLTQTDLAGKEMTKSMLSQIENNISLPSMRNLQYISAQLNKSLSYFLEEQPEKEPLEVHLPMDEINILVKDIDKLIGGEDEDIKKAKEQLELLLNKYEFNKKDKLYADLISKLGNCLLDLHIFEDGENSLNEAVNIYLDNYLYLDGAKNYISLILIPWNNHDYEACMRILEKVEEIYNKSITRDMFFEIKLFRTKATISFALENEEESFYYIEKAINLSNNTNIHYESDELYRMKAVLNLILDENTEFESNITKAQQFAEFTENKKSLSLILLTKLIYENRQAHHQRALEYLEEFKNQPFREIAFYYNAEKAVALYNLGDYMGAFENMKQVDFQSNESRLGHKYYYLNLWNYKIHEGLILNKLKQPVKAIEAITMGINKLKVFSNSMQLTFAYKSLSEVYSAIGNFENAFKSLKKSDEVQEYLRIHRKKLF